MSRLIRMDQTGHTTLAEWSARIEAVSRRRWRRFRRAGTGLFRCRVSTAKVTREQVCDLPVEASLVILRRPIAGG